MIKHVCIRTTSAGDDTMYVTSKDQPEGGGINYGTFFDTIEDAQDLQKKMSKRWPTETFEVFSVIKR